ncbi:MAG: glycosyltransferase family 1 protein [Candidatus Sumerlaeales bacterium]|nr:glycosyltransferase family 1 protein [Candidatus Sumerlaeales bacterium]
MKTIAIDARYISNEYSGIGTYSLNLIKGLAAAKTDFNFIVIVHKNFQGGLDLPSNFKLIKHSARPVSLTSVFFFDRFLERYKPDILHTLAPIVPIFGKRRLKIISSVYDLQPLQDPDFTWRKSKLLTLFYKQFYRCVYPASMKRSDWIVSPSYATKRFINKNVPSVSDKVIVIPMAVPQDINENISDETTNAIVNEFAIPKRFLLYVGSTRPNKNLKAMVEAFGLFITRNIGFEDLQWVMIVKPDRFWDSVSAKIRELNLTERIHIHMQVSSLAKKVFFERADLLYFVTKYEGFGLPVLEAQALRVPVLASTHASLPEVAGSAALLANPDSPEDICQKLEYFYNNDYVKEQLINDGIANVKRFTWDAVIKDHIDLYTILCSDSDDQNGRG